MLKLKLGRSFWLAVGVLLLVLPSAPGAAQTPQFLRFLGFSPQTPPADSLAFRQAVASAIDREAVARAVTPHLRTTPRPALTIQHPNLPGHNPAVQALPYDPARAKEFLAQSGWTGPVTILVGTISNPFLEAFYQAVTESLRRTLGAAVTSQQVANFDTLVRATRNGTAAVYSFAWQSDSRDFGYPSFALGIAHEVVSDAEVRALSETRNVESVERMLFEKVLIVPIIHY